MKHLLNILKILINAATSLCLILLWWGMGIYLHETYTQNSFDLIKGDSVSAAEMLPFFIIAIRVAVFCTCIILKKIFKLSTLLQHVFLFLISCFLLVVFLSAPIIWGYSYFQ